MTTLIVGMTISLIGNILIGITVIRVHIHLANERKVDGDVIAAIRREKYLAAAAIILMVIGYFVEIAHFLKVTI